MYTSSRNMYVVMCRCIHPVETFLLLCVDVPSSRNMYVVMCRCTHQVETCMLLCVDVSTCYTTDARSGPHPPAAADVYINNELSCDVENVEPSHNVRNEKKDVNNKENDLLELSRDVKDEEEEPSHDVN